MRFGWHPWGWRGVPVLPRSSLRQPDGCPARLPAFRRGWGDLRSFWDRGWIVAVGWWVWAAVVGVILVVLAIDLLAHRGERAVGVREAAVWSGVWVALGVAF